MPEETLAEKKYVLQMNHEEAASVTAVLAAGLMVLAPENLNTFINEEDFPLKHRTMLVRCLGRIGGAKTGSQILHGILTETPEFLQKVSENMDVVFKLSTALLLQLGEDGG